MVIAYTGRPRQKKSRETVILISKIAKKELTDAFSGCKFFWSSDLFIRKEHRTVHLRWLKGMQCSKLGICERDTVYQ